MARHRMARRSGWVAAVAVAALTAATLLSASGNTPAPAQASQAVHTPRTGHPGPEGATANDGRHEKRHAKPPNQPPPPVTVNCALVVPTEPLTALGLATPYRLRGADGQTCHEADTARTAFVEAAILAPDTGAVSIYHPLVIDDGSTPAAAATVPTIAAGSVVAVWFGFQGDVLTLTGPGARGCVNGAKRSPFGQFAYCGAPAFFAAADSVTIPPVATGLDGQPCPTTRDFSVVDQDQSDNLITTYLSANGKIAQNTAANRAALPGAKILANASDNRLLDLFIDPALGCLPLTAPDIGDNGNPTPSLALNELQAAAVQGAPVALVPPNDPMTRINGRTSNRKTNLYRLGVNQPRVTDVDTAANYCTNLMTIAPVRFALDAPVTANAKSPDPAMNLHDFLAGRFAASLVTLGCPVAPAE